MTRFIMFTDEELIAIESASYNEKLIYLVDEIRSANELKMQVVKRYKDNRKISK